LNSKNRVVSSEAEELILVDANDTGVGYLTKAACHDGEGVLHRAFSLFLFNEAGDLLLQQRSEDKRLWPGYWSNSCCSHPRRGETMPVATRRRLLDELNIEAVLEFVYRFSYQARFGDQGSENELCHVYLGKTSHPVQPNEQEISAIRHVSANTLGRELDAMPEQFTPWFKMEWQALQNEHSDTLAKYCKLGK